MVSEESAYESIFREESKRIDHLFKELIDQVGFVLTNIRLHSDMHEKFHQEIFNHRDNIESFAQSIQERKDKKKQQLETLLSWE